VTQQSSISIDPRDRLIVALDLPSVAEAEKLVANAGEAVSFYKIGYQLGYAGGLDFAKDLARSGKKVFLDLKLHDIGNTVGRGVESVAKLGATFLTVHAYPQTMSAALDARKGSSLRILAVTILTSYNDRDVAEAGYAGTVSEQVKRRATRASELGVDGIVCSPEESAMLRPLIAPHCVLVTPGIRPAGAETGDQKRIMTPSAAIRAGSDYLVVGRPITAAGDPKAAAEAIAAEIRKTVKA
jgi:orotidine-5'-phosphate decarboxylase